jgi:hypothetical protein
MIDIFVAALSKVDPDLNPEVLCATQSMENTAQIRTRGFRGFATTAST